MIPLSRPSIRRRDMDAVLSCMVTDRVGPGSLADELVTAVGDYLGLAGGVAVRERSRAIAIALDHLGLAREAHVILDPLAPHTYHQVLHDRGIVPVYVDCSASSLCIDAALVEREVARLAEAGTPAAAIVTRTALGNVPDMEAIAELGVPIIEDVSEGIGGNTGTERVGRFGRLVIVAMEPDGVITAGGGTLLIVASRAEKTALRREADVLPEDALLPDMNAAFGLTQIHEIERYVARRAEIASVYTKAIMRGHHASPTQPGDAQNVFLTFPVMIDGSVTEVTGYARKKGVEASLAFAGSVLERFGVRDSVAEAAASESDETSEAVPQPDVDPRMITESAFPVARSLLLRCVRFPLYPSLTSKEIATIERVLSTLP